MLKFVISLWEQHHNKSKHPDECWAGVGVCCWDWHIPTHKPAHEAKPGDEAAHKCQAKQQAYIFGAETSELLM